LYYSPNITRLFKRRRIGWVGHVAHMRTMRNAYKDLIGKPEGQSLGVDGMMILKLILKN
jgi:hypothetical protein